MNNDQSPWKTFETRRRIRDEKRAAVLLIAVQMFLKDGYQRTSLTDVAAALNITKPALYNYFRSKSEILAECYREGFQKYDENLLLAGENCSDGISRLRELIKAYAQAISTDFGRCVVRFDERELDQDVAAEVRQTKRRIDSAFRQAIIQGVDDGSIHCDDVTLASFAITGALNQIGTWFDPSGKYTAKEVAEHFAGQLTRGIQARPGS